MPNRERRDRWPFCGHLSSTDWRPLSREIWRVILSISIMIFQYRRATWHACATFRSWTYGLISKKPKRHRSAHDVIRKVRPHRSYHAYVLWHLQYLSTAVLCSTCKTLRHSISTLTHALKHLAAAESNVIITLRGPPVRPSCFEVQIGCGPFMGTGDPKRLNHTCTEVVLRGSGQHTDGRPNLGGQIPATFGTRSRSHQRRAKFGESSLGAKSGQRIRNLVTQSPTGPNPGGQIRGATGSQIRATAVTHVKKREDPQTQALFQEKWEKNKKMKNQEKWKEKERMEKCTKNEKWEKRKNEEGGDPNPEKGRGLEGGDGGKKFAHFFLLPSQVSFFLLSLGESFSWNFGRSSRSWPAKSARFGFSWVILREPQGGKVQRGRLSVLLQKMKNENKK